LFGLMLVNTARGAGCGHLGCLPHHCLSGRDGPVGCPAIPPANAAAAPLSISLQAAAIHWHATIPLHVDTDTPDVEPEVSENSRMASDRATPCVPMPGATHLVDGASIPLYLTHQSLLC
jgi:hypothetical protein